MNRVEALRECAEITRREARNFHYGLRLLPARPRLALYAIYAWMRVLDDLADRTDRSVEEKSHAIDRFEEATRAVLAGAEVEGADHRECAVLTGLHFVTGAFPVEDTDILGAIEGQRMDLEPRVYRSWDETRLYCDLVAATVGRICLDVWGVRDGADPVAARALSTERGLAFQLVNILRDIREDHALGRSYLPADELAAAGITVEDLVAWRHGPRCAEFMRSQCARAARLFDGSAALESLVSPQAVATLGAMTAIYRRILVRIERDPERALAVRVSLPAFEKLAIALRARFGLLPRRSGVGG